jgi:hypothetical protein
LLSKLFGQHNDAIDVANKVVSGIDSDVLPIVADLDRLINRDDLEQGPRGCGADVASEYLDFGKDILSRATSQGPEQKTYRVVQGPLLVHVAETTINHRPHGAASLGPGRHQAAVESIRGAGRAGHKDYGTSRDRVDL